MDTSLAIAAERLRIKRPYAKGDHNDHRTCIEFLESIISESKERLRKEEGGLRISISTQLKIGRKHTI